MGKYEAVAIRRAPHVVLADALNRAVRTWWQAVGAGVLVAIGDLGLKLLASGDVYSADFWGGLLKGAITALVTASLAYLSRFKAPPPPELTPPTK